MYVPQVIFVILITQLSTDVSKDVKAHSEDQ